MDIPPLPIFSTAEEVTLTPIKRAEAAARALRFFFTGRPCAHGHVARRYVSTGTCVKCQREHSLQHSKLYRTLRIQRGIGRPYFIVEGNGDDGDEALMEAGRTTIRALGLRVKDVQRGPQEQARMMRMAPPDWKPPQELVAPVISSTRIVELKSGMGAAEYQDTPEPIPFPPHLLKP